MTYPYNAELDVDSIAPNLYNPNVMTDAEFELLEKNIQEVGFLDPILVIPKWGPNGEEYYQIVDGEHRYEAQRMLGFDKIPAVVADPDTFDEKTQKLQTVRMNQIKGKLDTVKFNNLINDLINNHELKFDELAEELGFADTDEFQLLIDDTRRALPNVPGIKKEFNQRVQDVKSQEDLMKLVDRLLKKYGNTLPANFMILDFSRQHNVMVKMNASMLAGVLSKFREILESGYTVDSILYHFLKNLDMSDYVNNYSNSLTKIDENAIDDIDVELANMQDLEAEAKQCHT